MKTSLNIKFTFFVFLAAMISGTTALTAEDESFFPFSPSWNINKDSLANLSWLNHQHPLSRLTVNEDGRLADSSGRVRLVGMNITSIPEKKDAAMIARKLSAMGINIVRMHHIDALWTMNSLYEGKWSNPPLEMIPENLDKLDYFLNELAGENIMVNFNFLTGRHYVNMSAVPNFIRTMKAWKDLHVLAFFRPEVKDLQKKTIKEILAHKNPYRKLTYAEDPLIALVEIINENGLMHAWQAGWLDSYTDRDDFLRKMWNRHLKNKFGTQQAFEKKLGCGSSGTKVLFDLSAKKDKPEKAFHLENHQGAESELSGKAGKNPSIRLITKKPGSESWHIQFGHSGFAMKKGALYTLSFQAKSRTNSEISVSLSMGESPWQNLGFSTSVNPGRRWTEYSFSISPNQNFKNARFMFSGFGLIKKADIELKEIKLVTGGTILPTGQSIDKQNIALPRKRVADFTMQLKQEWLEFLYTLEDSYWQEMKTYTEDTCGYKGITIGTIVGTSTHLLQSRFELIDAHAYFNHPVFTEQPWDLEHWYVKNRSLLREADLDILSGLAMKRVVGKPFIVSEVDAPAPNEFNAELFPVLAAFALAQNWDGFFAFNLNADGETWDSKRIAGFFDDVRNPAKAAGLQAAALAFRRGDFPAMKKLIPQPVNRKKEFEMIIASDWGWNFGNLSSLGWDRMDSLKDAVGVTSDKIPPSKTIGGETFPDTGIQFDSRKGWFTAISDRSIFCVGFMPKKSWTAGSFTFSGFNSSTGFGLLSLQTRAGTFEDSGKILLTAAVNSRNTDMGVNTVSKTGADNELLTARADFGKAPVLTEVPEGTVSLNSSASSVEVHALDESGAPARSVPVKKKGNSFTFTIGRKYRTIWYQINLK